MMHQLSGKLCEYIYYKLRSCYLMNSLFIPMKDSMISYTNNYFDETIFPSSDGEKNIL